MKNAPREASSASQAGDALPVRENSSQGSHDVQGSAAPGISVPAPTPSLLSSGVPSLGEWAVRKEGRPEESQSEHYDEELADTARSVRSPRDSPEDQGENWSLRQDPKTPDPMTDMTKLAIAPRRQSVRDGQDSSKSPSPSPDIGSMSISGPPSRTESHSAHSPTWRWKSGGQSAAERRPQEGELLMPWPRRAEKYYQCIRSCGSGSFGEVFQARRLSDGKIVAVKVMVKDLWALEEASLLRELDHECICKLYDCFECPEENVTCLVMQYAAGGDLLARIIKSGPLTEPRAADIVRQLLGALRYMHDKGVIHRDLKPDNVLYSAEVNGRPLLADFGVSKKLFEEPPPPGAPLTHKPHPARGAHLPPPEEVDEATARFLDVSRSRYIGTIGYSAPEVNSSAGHSFAADVWSFGALVYVLLCGHHPFDYGNDPDEVITARVRKGDVLPMEGETWKFISQEATDFIGRCLVVDVTKRATIAECQAHTWLSATPQRDEKVIELVDAFHRLKMLHTVCQERKREHSASVACSREASVALASKRKREASVTSDDGGSGADRLTPTPCKNKRIINTILPPTEEMCVGESAPTGSAEAPLDPLHPSTSAAPDSIVDASLSDVEGGDDQNADSATPHGAATPRGPVGPPHDRRKKRGLSAGEEERRGDGVQVGRTSPGGASGEVGKERRVSDLNSEQGMALLMQGLSNLDGGKQRVRSDEGVGVLARAMAVLRTEIGAERPDDGTQEKKACMAVQEDGGLGAAASPRGGVVKEEGTSPPTAPKIKMAGRDGDGDGDKGKRGKRERQGSEDGTSGGGVQPEKVVESGDVVGGGGGRGARKSPLQVPSERRKDAPP